MDTSKGGMKHYVLRKYGNGYLRQDEHGKGQGKHGTKRSNTQ